jgi:predicted DNA-binding transcriptional regulator AlpA
MLAIVYGYQSLLDNIESFIDDSKFKKEYLIEKLGVSRTTFYKWVKKKNFSVNEMLILSTILFSEEANILELKEALKESREDSEKGRVKSNENIMLDVRKKLRL